MHDALTISGLTKTYKDFVLDGVSFSVPSGSIVGLIGENGAGKSTTISATLGLIQKEAGSVSVLGKEELDNEIKEQVGVVFDGSNYPEILSPRKLNRVLKNIYQSWDERTFLSLLKKLSLPIYGSLDFRAPQARGTERMTPSGQARQTIGHLIEEVPYEK